MATAGRILIMPKGTWNAETTYENLDMVAHSGRAWLAKKVSVGIEPSDANAEFWHDFLGMDVFTEENPPTAAQVGAVSLYADPVLSKSTDWDNLESGTYRFNTWGGSGGVGYPPIDDVGICILFDTEAGRYMYCLGMNRIVSRYYESKTWSDWIEGYLPLSGGTLSGSELYLANGYSRLLADVGVFQIEARNANNTHENMRVFRVDASNNATLANALRFKDRISHNETEYKIFGEHNKPSGSYTGNGSATERTINIGGVGQILLVISYQGLVILKNDIGFAVTPDGVKRIQGTNSFSNGVLTLKEITTYLNQNGLTYTYYVL